MSECLFCGIVEGKIKGAVVYRDASVVAFKDINPKAPVHILIVPVKHLSTLLDLQGEDQKLVGDMFFVANRLAKEQGISRDGFRVVANCGAALARRFSIFFSSSRRAESFLAAGIKTSF